jgi:predicted dehydrogenase
MMDKSLISAFGRRIRLGMVGGGTGSIIGDTHLLAMRADGFCELVAGALSSRPTVALESASKELLAPDRRYTDFHTMAEREAERPDRIDAVVIATPPQLHLPVATASTLSAKSRSPGAWTKHASCIGWSARAESCSA